MGKNLRDTTYILDLKWGKKCGVWTVAQKIVHFSYSILTLFISPPVCSSMASHLKGEKTGLALQYVLAPW